MTQLPAVRRALRTGQNLRMDFRTVWSRLAGPRDAGSGFKPGLDAVVVNYRTPQDLEDFVAAIDESEPRLDINLVLANVHPREDDIAAAERAMKRARRRLAISHIAFDSNVGYSRACNRGLLGGTHDVVALFNADAQARPGVLSACRKAVLKNPQYGALGPRQVDQLGRITVGGTVGSNDKPTIRGFRQPDEGQFSEVLEGVVNVAGSAYFMRRRVWQELTDCPTFREAAPDAEGAFLPTPLYFEETWCSYHAAAHGYTNVFYGTEVMQHTWHASIEANNSPHLDLFYQSKEIFRRACDMHGIERD